MTYCLWVIIMKENDNFKKNKNRPKATVTELNKPNIRLMSKALINMYIETEFYKTNKNENVKKDS